MDCPPTPLGAGQTVAHPSFAHLQLPAQAVIVEIWRDEQAELDNGLLLPVSELTLIDTGEKWRSIENYESYLISSHGKVVGLRYNRQPRQRLMRILKPQTYPFIILMSGGDKKQCGINRLVAQTFLPAPEARMTIVIPLDGNHLNLRADNLRWVDPLESEDLSVVGYLHLCGSRHHLSKLTLDQIMIIRQQVAAGQSHQAIADALGVSRPTISSISAGKAWRLLQSQQSTAPSDTL